MFWVVVVVLFFRWWTNWNFPSATKNIKAALNAVIERMKIYLKKDKIRSKYIVFRRNITHVIYCSVLDSSCGDMTWMPSFLSSRSDVEYTGYDILEANIKNHREKFRDTDWKYQVLLRPDHQQIFWTLNFYFSVLRPFLILQITQLCWQ